MKYLLLIFISFIFLGCDSYYTEEKMTKKFEKETNFSYLRSFNISFLYTRVFFKVDLFPTFIKTPKECDKSLSYTNYPYLEVLFSEDGILEIGKEAMFEYSLKCASALEKEIEIKFSKKLKAVEILKTPFKD